jgi:hypothetical protein
VRESFIGYALYPEEEEIAHFVQIRLQTWLPQEILVSDWSISK